jgi:hypothetical protein
MTRPRIVLGPNGAYWVTADAARGMPLFRAPWAAELLIVTLSYFRQALNFKLYAYTVLPTTFEAVIQPGDAKVLHGSGGNKKEVPLTISKIMMEVKGSFAHWYNRRVGRTGSVWEKRFKDRTLLNAEEIKAATIAVHGSPVLLGLADRPDLYPYSGLSSARNPIRMLDALPVREGGVPVAVRAA